MCSSRIAVSGTKARLHVRITEQPYLIVNDLKLGPAKGEVALWIEPGTAGYFANLGTPVQKYGMTTNRSLTVAALYERTPETEP
jgi:hypothetical protein